MRLFFSLSLSPSTSVCACVCDCHCNLLSLFSFLILFYSRRFLLSSLLCFSLPTLPRPASRDQRQLNQPFLSHTITRTLLSLSLPLSPSVFASSFVATFLSTAHQPAQTCKLVHLLLETHRSSKMFIMYKCTALSCVTRSV